MRNFFSTVTFVVLFATLGIAGYLTIPKYEDREVSSNSGVVLASQAPNLAAPSAGEVLNAIALPLDVQASWATQGIDFNAAGLGSYIGPSVKEVLKLNTSLAALDSWSIQFNFGVINGVFTTDPNDFPLEVGGSYWIKVDNTSADVVSFVGDVPAEGIVDFDLVYLGSGSCTINSIMIPLDQYDQNINNAVDLANAITTTSGQATQVVEQVLQLNSTLVALDT
ncbi:MAG: hypothetical protein KDE56_30385, partial [Anaerolineales bacterium]|nr:hypothetical protein [Anaerolineales bacterium]